MRVLMSRRLLRSLPCLLLVPTVLFAALPPQYEAARRAQYEQQMEEARDEAEIVLKGRVLAASEEPQPTPEALRVDWVDDVRLTVEVLAVRRSDGDLAAGDTVEVRYRILHHGYGWAGPAQYEPERLEAGAVVYFYLNRSGADPDAPLALAAGDMSFVDGSLELAQPPPQTHARWRGRPHMPWWRRR